MEGRRRIGKYTRKGRENLHHKMVGERHFYKDGTKREEKDGKGTCKEGGSKGG